MQTYVINLDRRPDRRAHMEAQASASGVAVEFVSAVDMRRLGDYSGLARRRGGPRQIRDGDYACFLSHRRAWERIVARGEPFGAVLEDDVGLSADAARLLNRDDWIPPGTQLVKIERYGGRRVALSAAVARCEGHELLRLHSKYVGAGGYVVSAEAAGLLLRRTRVIGDTVDHFLFNPGRSPVFARLRPLLLEPAICRQLPGQIGSDLVAGRRRGWRGELGTATVEVLSLPRQIAYHLGLLRKEARGVFGWRRVTFGPEPARVEPASGTPAGAAP